MARSQRLLQRLRPGFARDEIPSIEERLQTLIAKCSCDALNWLPVAPVVAQKDIELIR